ncbi:MAG: alpha/beta hydrolase-fold protein [Erythrobacter sp.]|uniref:alpha/beta hydrolase n=1 Tax=Erythrobacter sp. TaxID=1042 RepID=UPI003264DE4A
MQKMCVFNLKTALFCLIFAISAVSPISAQQTLSIQSESTQDTREIVVHLPKNYDPNSDERYAVIYMLDAGAADKMTAEIASFYHWGDLMPEVIVVGLENVNRGPDFLPHYYSVERDGEQIFGNGRNLLSYIENELIPFVNSQFKTNDNKVFAGHSWAGQYLAYTLSQSPGLFDAYFITSPAFGEWSGKTFEALEEALTQDQDYPDLIYLSSGGDGSPGPLSDAELLPSYYRLAALLRQHLPDEVKLVHEIHDSANHTSNSAISMAIALELYFAASPEAE